MENGKKALKALGESGWPETIRGQKKQMSVYDLLALLNHHSAAFETILASLSKKGFIPKKDFALYRSMVEEVLALSSQMVLEALDEKGLRVAAKVSRRRIELERSLSNS
jgi:hypothetical protein